MTGVDLLRPRRNGDQFHYRREIAEHMRFAVHAGADRGRVDEHVRDRSGIFGPVAAADVQHEELLTERQSLRRPMPEDIDAILAIHRDPRTCAHNPSDALASRGEAEALFARWDEHWKHHGFGYWVVRYGGATGPVGFCGLKVMQFRERAILNLLYRFDPAVWGQGLAAEAATAVVAWAGKHEPQRPVIARVRPANTVSARVAARAGLTRAENLDGPGYDGHDLIFVSEWIEAS